MKYKQLQMLIEASYTRARDRPCFQTARFLSFGKSAIPANEGKKQMPKLSARANKVFIGMQNLQHEPGTDLVFTKNFAINLKSM